MSNAKTYTWTVWLKFQNKKRDYCKYYWMLLLNNVYKTKTGYGFNKKLVIFISNSKAIYLILIFQESES